MMLRSRCRPNFFVNSPDRFNRFRMYWPHKHFPCVTKSCVGITTGNFHPIVLDNFRVTTSLTLLNRRRAENVFGSLSNDDECNAMGKLNFRLVSATGNRSAALVDSVCVVAVVVVIRGLFNDDAPNELPKTLSGDSILSFLVEFKPKSQWNELKVLD